ncbi:MAG: phytanoyl-CoA dioxygenase family protein [Thermoanaerobaculia bacterium]
MLKPEEKEAFRRDGFLKLTGVLSPPELEVCRQRTAVCMEDPASGAIFRYGQGGRRIHGKIPQLAERDGVFRGIAQHSGVAEAVEDLLGPARIFRDVVIVKTPVAGAVVHYHQDAAYWDIDRPELALSAWIALDDAPKEAGCLQVVPGSHRGATEHTILLRGRRLPNFVTRSLRRATSLTGTGDNPRTARERAFASLKTFALGGITRFVPALNDLNDLRVDPDAIAPEALVSLPARAGDVIFFSSWLIHGSATNTSAHLRRAYIVSYMADACQVPGRPNSAFLPARPI